jgi:hypothetical protein
MERSSTTGIARLVLLSIASWANPQGEGAHPSYRSIAHRAGLRTAKFPERTVQRHVKRLAEVGVELEVHFKRGPNGTNLYSVLCAREEDIQESSSGETATGHSDVHLGVEGKRTFGTGKRTSGANQEDTQESYEQVEQVIESARARERSSAARPGGAASAAPKKAGRAQPWGDSNCRKCSAPITSAKANTQSRLCDDHYAELMARTNNGSNQGEAPAASVGAAQPERDDA